MSDFQSQMAQENARSDERTAAGRELLRKLEERGQLRQVRKSVGATQEEMAQALGTSQMSISRKERAERSVADLLGSTGSHEAGPKQALATLLAIADNPSFDADVRATAHEAAETLVAKQEQRSRDIALAGKALPLVPRKPHATKAREQRGPMEFDCYGRPLDRGNRGN